MWRTLSNVVRYCQSFMYPNGQNHLISKSVSSFHEIDTVLILSALVPAIAFSHGSASSTVPFALS